MVERINPLQPKPTPRPAETATVLEVANNGAEPASLNLVPVTCGEFGKDVPALADLAQRVVVPLARQ